MHLLKLLAYSSVLIQNRSEREGKRPFNWPSTSISRKENIHEKVFTFLLYDRWSVLYVLTAHHVNEHMEKKCICVRYVFAQLNGTENLFVESILIDRDTGQSYEYFMILV